MIHLIEAVWVRSTAEWTTAQRNAAREACGEYLHWLHPDEKPSDPAINAFLANAMESNLSACWWFTSDNDIDTSPDKLLEVMRRHCEPVGLSVSGHLSC